MRAQIREQRFPCLNKAAIRKTILASAESADCPAQEVRILSRAQQLIAELVSVRKELSTVLGVYYPKRHEVNPMALAREPYALPKIIDYNSKQMAFFACESEHNMQANRFGICEPCSDKRVEPTLLIVPLIAADTHCHRLGHGHGYYDRYIAQARLYSRPLITIGLCYNFQLYHNLPIEPHDQPLDYIITHNAIYSLHSIR